MSKHQHKSDATKDFVPEQGSQDTLRASDFHEGTRPFGRSPTKASTPTPTQIDNFRILDVLGEGAFGRVLKAIDERNETQIALKVPNPDFIRKSRNLSMFFDEAKMAARLDHPGLVRILEYRNKPDLPYIVMEFIDGVTLGQWASRQQYSLDTLVAVFLKIADALAYLHRQKLFHRDLKPDNVLVDKSNVPHVADFGLALDEETRRARIGEFAGTLPYMSPEQIRGETNNIDGRSDVWSWGVMFYEILASCRPFRGADQRSLMASILNDEAIPLRQRVATTPRELQRICAKCLEKSLRNRYSSMTDLVDDLSFWVKHGDLVPHTSLTSAGRAALMDADEDSTHVAVVPKGLRSFESHDAAFFLKLLPGARDRNGIPESIRFWLTRIEGTTEVSPVRIGVVYGPSGSGKSSLVQAGILPFLSEDVETLVVSATPHSTEKELLQALKKQGSVSRIDGPMADIQGELLPEFLRHLQNVGLPRHRKLLLVIDQFEQWLQMHSGEVANELIHALRHCDGHNLQALLIVRDDFLMELTSFLDRLEQDMRVGVNASAVERFTLTHAEFVLHQLGQGYGNVGEVLTPREKRFITEAVKDLAEGNRVVGVRLALFAENMKQKPWRAGYLRKMGGALGVGTAFLDESFSLDAPAENKRHEKAARAVLEALLPANVGEIKASATPAGELQAIAGYEQKDGEFRSLIAILSDQLKLITPVYRRTDQGTQVRAGELVASPEVENTEPSYQLTHDYLVASIREWLLRGQRGSREGRAKLALVERADDWRVVRKSRHLPSLFEWLGILRWTPSSNWTTTQRKMMAAAAKKHMLRCLMATTVGCLMFYFGILRPSRLSTESVGHLISQLVTVPNEEVPNVAQRLHDYGSRAESHLQGLANSRLLIDTEVPNLHKVLFPHLGDSSSIETILDISQSPPAEEPRDRTRIGSRRAQAAITLLKLGRCDDAIRCLLIDSDDPEVLSQFAHRAQTWGVTSDDLATCIRTLTTEAPASDEGNWAQDARDRALQTCLLALGGFGQKEMSKQYRDELIGVAEELFRDHPASAVHGAAEWMLRNWGFDDRVDEITAEIAGPLESVVYSPALEWFVARIRAPGAHSAADLFLPFVVFPPGEYTIGHFGGNKNELVEWPIRTVQVKFPFAVLNRELLASELWSTHEEYRSRGYQGRFQKHHKHYADFDDRSVAFGMNWFECASFCKRINESWLELGAEHAFAKAKFNPKKPFAELRSVPMDLAFPGLRMPTEAEWEIAIRAGTHTRYSFGSDSMLIPEYARHLPESEGLVGRPYELKPNLRGIFGGQGNLLEWCFDWHSNAEFGPASPLSGPPKSDSGKKVCRSGFFTDAGATTSIADRWPMLPGDRALVLGFRPVLTLK